MHNKPRQRFTLPKYWPVSIFILVLIIAGSILLVKFSPAFASYHAPAHPAASAPPPDPIIGDWNVTYGSPSVVTMSGSGGTYSETAESPVQVTGSSCYLPPGTLISTFSGSGNTYSGQHGIWYINNCSFDKWVSMSLTLNGTTLNAVLGQGYGSPTFTKVISASPPSTATSGGGFPNTYSTTCSCAAPVNTATGEFWHHFDDLIVPGRGMVLNFNRTYSASLAAQDGPIGHGWIDSYQMALTIDSATGNITFHASNGSMVTFTANRTTYQPPSYVLASLVKNGDGTYTYKGNDQRSYIFSTTGQLLKEVDRNNYVTTLTYSNSQLSKVTDPAGRTLSFAYGSNGRIATVIDPASRKISFTYDASGNLITATDVNGGIWQFSYDANHLMLTMTNPLKGVLTNIYDASSRVTSQSDPLGRKTTFAYVTGTTGSSTTTMTDAKANQTLYQYQNLELTSVTTGYGTPQAATTTYTYDAITLGVSSVTDPNGHTLFQTWDIFGNKLSATDPLGRLTKYTYDSMNDLTSITAPNGITTKLTYNASGNLLSITTPLTSTGQNRITTFTDGDASHPGDVTAIIDPDGNTWSYTYDANGDRTAVTDPLHNSMTYQYNSIGWQTAQVTALGHSTSYTYSNFGDVTQVKDPLGHTTSTSYDANRNLVKIVDAAGNTTKNTYDLDNELTKTTRADGSILAYSYDKDGNQITYSDALGKMTTYSFANAAYPQDETAVTDALANTTSYGYDLAGNLTSLTNPAGKVTTYAYDGSNELTNITYNDGKTPNVTYAYDANGQRIKMTDGTGTTNYTYDSLNRLIQSTNGAGSTVAYSYDLKGQLLSLVYPGGQQVTRTYDATGRLNTVTDWLSKKTSFGYDADSNLTSETYPNGVKATFKYDKNNQVTSIADALGSTSLLSFTYIRNKLSQLTSTTPTGVPQSNETYAYTTLNQLSTVNTPTYKYDHGDNLTQIGTSTLTYNAANELTSLAQTAGTTTFSYDTQGNMVTQKAPSGTTTTLTYDQANRLTAYGTTATYTYNGDGLRMSKTVAGTPEAFTWNVAEGLPLLLQDGTTLYVYGPGGLPLEQVNSSTTLYYHQDQLGSTRALTNSTGTVVATYGYDAYGNVTGKTGSVTTPIQYAGQYTDSESGLQYLRARYYDPAIGQFLTRDPIVRLTQQAYGYAANDPLNAIDPSGRDPISTGFDIASTVLGYGGLFIGGEGYAAFVLGFSLVAFTYYLGKQVYDAQGDWHKVDLVGVGLSTGSIVLSAFPIFKSISGVAKGVLTLVGNNLNLAQLARDAAPSKPNIATPPGCLKARVQYTRPAPVG